jgi:rifampicin phosphotransferase
VFARLTAVHGVGGVVPLRDAMSRDQFGGKAASLAVLVRAGLPVPDGFVLDHGTVQTIPVTRNGELVERLSDALARLSAGHGAVAVRSSATVEDGHDHSYGGVFVPKLNVPKQVHAVVSTVRELHNAVTNPRTLSYQDCAGLVDEPIKLAVIVQTMVDARVSGVLFTDVAQDGTTGLLVEAVSGLGESLVSGCVRPQRYRVVAEQAHRVDREPAADLLTTQDIQGLASLAASVKKVFPRPQDVEWGIDRGGRVHIMQSRDITAPIQLPSAHYDWSLPQSSGDDVAETLVTD